MEQPVSIRVFERFGIDHCCGGRKPLAEACREVHAQGSDIDGQVMWDQEEVDHFWIQSEAKQRYAERRLALYERGFIYSEILLVPRSPRHRCVRQRLWRTLFRGHRFPAKLGGLFEVRGLGSEDALA